MKIKSKKIASNILVIICDNSYDLGMTFVRLQEFYESPEYKGKYFTLEEYMDYWIANQGNGVFNYPTVWSGFNVPGQVFLEWVNLFRPRMLRDKECQLLREVMLNFDGNIDVIRNSYIIGVSNSSTKIQKKDIIGHEVAHALYKTSEKYKASCDALLAEVRVDKVANVYSNIMESRLIKMGYCKDVIDDETQAYWSASRGEYSEVEIISKFEKNLKKHIKNNKIKIGNI